ncbi:MAG: hypothetical protein HY015_05960 [Bacteroidetes bacterium]|nr:hypothetical protein [Bacteroidota bacterium]
MKTKALSGHHEFSIRSPQLTSMMATVMSIIKFIIVVVGIALMFFK